MTGRVTAVFRGATAHSPSYAELSRSSAAAGPVDFRIPCGLEALPGARRGAAVSEPVGGTIYSSGTAAVDRVTGATGG